MVLRGTSRGFLSLDATTPAWETELTPMNQSGQALPPTFDATSLTLLLLMLVTALGGLAGNAAVLWLLGFRLRRNVFSVYILNLAGADFVLLCCHIGGSLNELITCGRSSPSSSSSFFTVLLIFVYLAGLSFLSAISTERCLSVLCPIWYRCHRPKHLSAIVCALLWAPSLLLSILNGKYCGLLLTDFNLVWCRVLDSIAAGWLMFSFALLTGSSLALMVRIFCRSQQIQVTRLYVTLVLTVLVFLLCGLPLGIHWFLLIWMQKDLFVFPYNYWLVVWGLSCVNSCANPIVYFFVGSFRQRQPKRRGRQTLKVVLQKALEDTSEVDESEGTLPQETRGLSASSLVS